MNHSRLLAGVCGVALSGVFGCSIQTAEETDAVGTVEQAQKGGLDRATVWAGCEKFGTVVTSATFEPNSTAFDQLYVTSGSFHDGVPLISDAAPGQGHYNGGRWHLNVLREEVDPMKYMHACSASDLDPEDFAPADAYFECPLLPMRSDM